MTAIKKEPRAEDNPRRAALKEAAAIARKYVGQVSVAAWQIPEVIAQEIERLDSGD